MDAHELYLQAFRAAGAEAGLSYLSVPITTGRRELELLLEFRCRPDDLRTKHRERWLADVVRPNEADAEVLAEKVRTLLPQVLVVNPAHLHNPDWSQQEYARFWDNLVSTYATRLIAAPGWEFSRGARAEVRLALRLGLPILDLEGRALHAEDIGQLDKSAAAWMERAGFTQRDIEDYLEDIELGSDVVPAEDASSNLAASEVFAWLRAERSYQVAKFGIEADDAHTLQGIGEGSWWSQQLTNYYHRAGVVGFETPVGRQAIAKFVATGCGLLESVVRLHGHLPTAGVPSGQNLDT